MHCTAAADWHCAASWPTSSTRSAINIELCPCLQHCYHTRQTPNEELSLEGAACSTVIIEAHLHFYQFLVHIRQLNTPPDSNTCVTAPATTCLVDSTLSQLLLPLTSSLCSPQPSMMLVLVMDTPASLAAVSTPRLCFQLALLSRTTLCSRSTVSTLCANTSRPELAIWRMLSWLPCRPQAVHMQYKYSTGTVQHGTDSTWKLEADISSHPPADND